MEPDIKQKIFSLKHNLKKDQAMCEMQLKDDQKKEVSCITIVHVANFKYKVCC